MIVIVGNPAWRAADPAVPAGRACEVAVAAAARGRRVELLGRAGDDAAGDALLLALAQAGVGHVAVLRDPARPTPIVEPAPEEAGAVEVAVVVRDEAPKLTGSAQPRRRCRRRRCGPRSIRPTSSSGSST